MAATRKDIEGMLRRPKRKSPCFGAPDTNPTFNDGSKPKNEGASLKLLDDFEW